MAVDGAVIPLSYARRGPVSAMVLGLLVAGCSLATEGTRPFEDVRRASARVDEASPVAGATGRPEAKSRYGNPATYVVFGQRYEVLGTSAGFVEEGIASWYGEPFHGRRTSSGETYDMYTLTAAHKHLPLPTYALVTNLDNGRGIVVRINDRGPFHEGRVIDLSYAAALELDMVGPGTARVRVRALEPAAIAREPLP